MAGVTSQEKNGYIKLTEWLCYAEFRLSVKGKSRTGRLSENLKLRAENQPDANTL